MAENVKTVLVVDDDPDARDFLATVLRDNGFIATMARDGMEAIAMIEEQKPDLVALDISMPEKSGVAVYRKLKEDEQLRGIPVIIVTGHGDSSTATHALAGGAYDYITKPLEPDLVLAAVTRALAIGRLRRRFKKTIQNAGVIGAITSGIANELDTPLNAITVAAEELSKQLNQIKHLTCLTLQADGSPKSKIPIADIDMDPAYKQIETITRSVLHCIRLLEALNVKTTSEP